MELNQFGRRLRVLVADDRRDIRRTIERSLRAEFDVVGSVENGRDLLRDALALHPDVIVTDVSMPFLTGTQVMDELKSRGHHIPFVLISAAFFGVDDFVRQGAKAVVSKLDLSCELAHAVRSAASGQTYISSSARCVDL
ncbi:MAG TPA: response regulator [Terriglobia bacterium]|nr:response regulator [Terriglobia bacterium]